MRLAAVSTQKTQLVILYFPRFSQVVTIDYGLHAWIHQILAIFWSDSFLPKYQLAVSKVLYKKA